MPFRLTNFTIIVVALAIPTSNTLKYQLNTMKFTNIIRSLLPPPRFTKRTGPVPSASNFPSSWMPTLCLPMGANGEVVKRPHRQSVLRVTLCYLSLANLRTMWVTLVHVFWWQYVLIAFALKSQFARGAPPVCIQIEIITRTRSRRLFSSETYTKHSDVIS